MPRGGPRPGAGAPKGNRNATMLRGVVVSGACYAGRHDYCAPRQEGKPGNDAWLCQCRCHPKPIR